MPEESHSTANVPGSASSLPHPALAAIGTRFLTVWIVVYAVPGSSSRAFTWIPISARFSWMVGVMLTNGGVVRFTNSTFLHTLESHTPSWFESYLDCFISFFAALTSPASFGVLYGS